MKIIVESDRLTAVVRAAYKEGRMDMRREIAISPTVKQLAEKLRSSESAWQASRAREEIEAKIREAK